jgi:hypothetical protein
LSFETKALLLCISSEDNGILLIMNHNCSSID